MNPITIHAPNFKVLLTLAILHFCGNVVAQNSMADSLNHKFDKYRTESLQEKLYVHLDSKCYLTGETIWFKIYYVDGMLHRPLDISKVAYVEILDKDNLAVVQTKVSLKEGEGSGSLFLPASINSGNFVLRAYTNWMRNFKPDYFFHTDISIVNSFKKLELDKTIKTEFNAQFFPEGGNLVNGIESKVAFQVIDVSGKGIDFTGFLIDQNNDTITSFKPLTFGIGNFFLTPVAGNDYRAVITDKQGQVRSFSLPKALAQGYVIEVNDSSASLITISVRSKFDVVPANPTIYLFVHARQIISLSEMRLVTSGRADFILAKKDLQEGISHITLFDSGLNPQCERLYFKHSEKELLLEAKVNQQEYGIRRKIILDITARHLPNPSDSTSLSVSVVKTDSLQSNRRGNIFSYLWLSSDLNGTIEAPEFYTDRNNRQVASAIDNLMLTHGWRRFEWKNILGKTNREKIFIPEYGSHFIRGKVINKEGQPMRGVVTYLSTPGKNIQLYGARSNSLGDVFYEMKDFNGAKRIIAQTNNKIDSTSRITIQNPFSQVFYNRDLPVFKLSPNLEQTLLSRSISMQVQDVFNEDKAERFANVNIDSAAFYGKADETYYLDDYTRFVVMEEVMREYVPGVMVRKRKDGFHFMVLDNLRRTVFQDDPLILVDGIPVFDVDKIMDFEPIKIKKLEVLTRKYYLGPLAFNGIVSYTTYAGDLAGLQLNPQSVSLDYEGLQRQRVFYSPHYSDQKQRESRIPDRRNLLYWAPKVTLSKEGKRQLEFYTSDLTGDYTIVIEGLTKDGMAGSTEQTFSVKQFNN
jgi:hypothetical protein